MKRIWNTQKGMAYSSEITYQFLKLLADIPAIVALFLVSIIPWRTVILWKLLVNSNLSISNTTTSNNQIRPEEVFENKINKRKSVIWEHVILCYTRYPCRFNGYHLDRNLLACKILEGETEESVHKTI